MNQATCSTIATLVPVLLLAIALEGRGVNVKLRLKPWYPWVVGAALVMGFAATGLGLYGTSAKGFEDGDLAIIATWIFTAVAGACTLFFLILVAVSIEVEADAVKARKAQVEKMRATALGRLRLRLFGDEIDD
jgi:Zn-dependent protease with chaperone function